MMMMRSIAVLVILLFIPLIAVNGFNLQRHRILFVSLDRSQQHAIALQGSRIEDTDNSVEANDTAKEWYTRRNILMAGFTFSALATSFRPEYAIAAIDDSSVGSVNAIVSEIQGARKQMNAIPDLIKGEQWDGIRAILITPPLSDLWTKSARKSPLLQDFANAVGAIPSGDELAVLEAKEDVEGHLRFLDMAVYNNNFNPIKSVGEIGATKALISSYYDDPINEYKATIAALDTLLQLGNVK